MRRWKRIALFGLTFTMMYLLYLQSAIINQPCGQFPNNNTLKYTHTWQTQQTHHGTLQLLSAFLDDRQKPWFFSQKHHTVRILGMFDNINPQKLYCQIWYETDVVIVESSHFWIWKKDWEQAETFYQPFVFSCDTLDKQIPKYVSLVATKCDLATNRLKIVYEKTSTKNDFVVCVKGLNFPDEDKSTRLIEWIELITLLGASKIHFYKFDVHSNVQRVLDYYQNKNRIAVTSLTLVGDYPDTPIFRSAFLRERKIESRLQGVLPFNDCLYTYLYKYKYIVQLDMDEVIVPKTGTWSDLMMHLHSRNGITDSYLARNVYFFDHLEHSVDVPGYMHILRHVTRSEEFSPPGDYVKGFHGTERVLALYEHSSLWCFGWWGCENVDIGVDLAQLQHYKGDCVKELRNCEELKNLVMDTRVWRFKDKLVARVQRVLVDLHLV